MKQRGTHLSHSAALPSARVGDALVPNERVRSGGVQTLTVTPDESGMRVDRIFEARFPGLNYSYIQREIRKRLEYWAKLRRERSGN